ncbi:hypothetical protein DMUE_2616 [Dictyocoela muelleri]|nr:hypothetical protein DMUE_2616 [Dictyocoela muelleri]
MVEKYFLETTDVVVKNCWDKSNLISNNESIIQLDHPEITVECSSTGELNLSNIMVTENFQITLYKCDEVLNSLKTTFKILQSYKSKHINECIDLQDKIISEYLELFYKDKLDFNLNNLIQK